MIIEMPLQNLIMGSFVLFVGGIFTGWLISGRSQE